MSKSFDMSDGEILSNLAGCERNKKTVYAHIGPFGESSDEKPSEVKSECVESSGPKVICISGKAQHGKDTTAGYLKTALEACGKRVLITHYGDLVKYVCKTFFDWNGEKDEYGRTLLQEVGTDRIRSLTPNFWVKFVIDILNHFPDKWDYVLIPDCRFPNEIDYPKDCGYDVIHVRVTRRNRHFVSPLTEEQQNHISETALDGVLPNCIVINRGTLDDLRDVVYELAGYLEKTNCGSSDRALSKKTNWQDLDGALVKN